MIKWILLVEDDLNDADMTLRVLTDGSQQVEVVHVKDGAEALSCLYHRDAFANRNNGPPALILLDLKMTRMDGFEVLQRVKNDTNLRSIPVAVFTSSREPSDVIRGYQLGTNAYVVKPVDFHEFVSTLHAMENFWLAINEPPPLNYLPRTSAIAVAAVHN